MSEIKDRQDAASDIDPIVAALADDTLAAATVEGLVEVAEPVGAEALPTAEIASPSDDAHSSAEPLAAADIASDTIEGEPLAAWSGAADDAATAPDAPVATAADFGDEAPVEPLAADDIADAIAAALSDEAAGPVAEPYAGASFEQMPAAYADTVVELDAGTDSAEDEAPLLDIDLEDGIASVFAVLRAAREDGTPVEPLGDLEAADGVTFRLLGELDRLWHRAA